MKYFVTAGEDRSLDPDTRAELRGRFLPCHDGITHYELTGPAGGELVVLIGGLTIPLFYWDQLVARLHDHGFRTLAYSGYGRGYSDRIASTYDEALFLRQLTDLLDGLGLGDEPRHVLGTSMGALVAMAHVEQHVHRTVSLTLVGPAGLEPRPPAGAALLRHELLGRQFAKRLGRRLLERHLSHNVRDPQQSRELTAMVRDCYRYEGSLYSFFATIADFPLAARHDLYRRTSHSPVPTMLVWGDTDNVTPITRFDEVRTLLAPAEAHVITDCGHMASYEQPGLVAQYFTSFAEKINRKAAR
ncbi:alpha/beta fold hydrolase [Nocardia otitidiscaviarum]|uniref:alpha/beta fold hydrolase n=1 Tax=Nocardia otitidiscaviarum TaxID=1823 RepID=UPI001893F332|nr:alpha/beta hydrolase [Nocardia otitidiscaviarum]MBF6180044.1 alpha/beta hydrolase [Nocardia otitidiscaviarum]